MLVSVQDFRLVTPNRLSCRVTRLLSCQYLGGGPGTMRGDHHGADEFIDCPDRLTSWRREERLELPSPPAVGLPTGREVALSLLLIECPGDVRVNSLEKQALWARSETARGGRAPRAARDRWCRSSRAGASASGLDAGLRQKCVLPIRARDSTCQNRSTAAARSPISALSALF